MPEKKKENKEAQKRTQLIQGEIIQLKSFPEYWNSSRVKVTVLLLSDADLACSTAIPGHISPDCLITASG